MQFFEQIIITSKKKEIKRFININRKLFLNLKIDK